jgi:hypothetical protein
LVAKSRRRNPAVPWPSCRDAAGRGTRAVILARTGHRGAQSAIVAAPGAGPRRLSDSGPASAGGGSGCDPPRLALSFRYGSICPRSGPHHAPPAPVITARRTTRNVLAVDSRHVDRSLPRSRTMWRIDIFYHVALWRLRSSAMAS